MSDSFEGTFDLTSTIELRTRVSDGQAFAERLRHFDLSDSVRETIYNAVTADRGVTLDELLQLFMNAAYEEASREAGRLVRSLPCNLEPACNLLLGHAGEV